MRNSLTTQRDPRLELPIGVKINHPSHICLPETGDRMWMSGLSWVGGTKKCKKEMGKEKIEKEK